MSIQEKRGVLHIVAFAILLSTMVATDVASKLEEQPPLLAYLIDSGVINLEMAELLRDNCMLELLHAQKTLQDLEFHFVEKKSSNSGELLNGRLSGTKMHDAVNALIPQVNQILVDCVRGKNRMLRDAGEAKSSYSWYTRYLGFLYNLRWSSTRRVLAQTPGAAPAPSPAVSSPSPAPSVPLSPTKIPASPSVPFFPTDYNSSNLQPTAAEQTNASSNQKTSKRTVIIAVVVTASVTFVIAALLFIFCRKCCGAGSGRGKNDERPLLSLSLSDYSIASSQKPFSLETPVNEEKLGNQSFNSKLNHNSISGNFYMESHSLSSSKIDIPVGTTAGAATNFVENSLQMPPRMLGTPGLPPLKPPPGRTDPPKPPPENATSPLPTAPVPPPAPPIKSSSGEPRPLPPGPPPPPPIPSRAKAGARPPPPPMPNGAKAGAPPPPPPPGAGVPPPRPPPIGLKPPRNVPPGPRHPTISTQESEAGTSKAKLKPFFWDKVLANPDHSMVWHQIKSGSFQFNEEMIETLFGYAPPGNNKNEAKKESSSQDVLPKYIQLIDPKKSQNLSITLKALNVTTEVCDALEEGNELPSELIQTLLKMAPTSEEELKLRLYSGELSQLGPAERFLKVLVDIPFAFKRLESLHFMCTLQEDISTLNESFAVLEAACTELRKSRLFFKLLEAVLKTGNRMNDGTFRGGAQAFKLDTLLKLSDVKGTDGKTTLLHFVVQEIIRSEGIKAARAAKETRSVSGIKSDVLEDSNQASDEHLRSLGLEVVSGLGNELENVKKAAVLDADSLTGTVARLGHALEKSRNFLNSDMKNVSEENGFHQMLRSFVRNAEVDVMWSREEVKRIMELVKNTADYFHGNSGKDEGLRLFVIVRDFLIILDKVCKEVKIAAQKSSRTSKKEDTVSAPPDPRQTTTPDPRQRLFPAIADRRIYTSSSSDDES